jgi:ribosomal protein S18 acetylase RimI-like enzyme
MLPEGYSWRRCTPDDATAIHALTSRCNTGIVGSADCTLADVRDELGEPDFVLETDSWLVHDAEGEVVGYGCVRVRGGGEQVDLDAITSDERVCRWLHGTVLARGIEVGQPVAPIFLGLYREDTMRRASAQAHGFKPVRTFYRMRIDHDLAAPLVDPVAPPGVTLRTGPGDEALHRTGHALLMESFKEHFGWLFEPFEDWHRRLDRESTFDWSMLTVAELDSRPVGVLMTSDHYLSNENCGYVGDLGVLAEARGRGIAKFLLRTAFAADIRAGRTGTILAVDTSNVTPALHVYESVGMRPVRTTDAWHYQRE